VEWEWVQEISGEPASKANSRRLVQIGGKPRFIKSQKALAYSRSFAAQVTPPAVPLEGDLEVGVVIWYASRRPDLDPSLIFDLLQATGVIVNDRQIKKISAWHSLNKENPHTMIALRYLSEDSGLPFFRWRSETSQEETRKSVRES